MLCGCYGQWLSRVNMQAINPVMDEQMYLSLIGDKNSVMNLKIVVDISASNNGAWLYINCLWLGILYANGGAI